TFAASLKKYEEAIPYIIQGHRNYREIKILEANADYMKAQQINPVDTSVQDLLNFEEIQRKVRGQENSLWARWMLAKCWLAQGRKSETVTLLNEIVNTPQTAPGT